MKKQHNNMVELRRVKHWKLTFFTVKLLNILQVVGTPYHCYNWTASVLCVRFFIKNTCTKWMLYCAISVVVWDYLFILQIAYLNFICCVDSPTSGRRHTRSLRPAVPGPVRQHSGGGGSTGDWWCPGHSSWVWTSPLEGPFHWPPQVRNTWCSGMWVWCGVGCIGEGDYGMMLMAGDIKILEISLQHLIDLIKFYNCHYEYLFYD